VVGRGRDRHGATGFAIMAAIAGVAAVGMFAATQRAGAVHAGDV
jgi:hypothetical protein